MLPVDLEQFWKDDKEAHKDNCFYEGAKQVALGIRMVDGCVFAELNEEGDPWAHTPRERRIELNKRYNDKAEKIVGRRLLNENLPAEDEAFPKTKRIGEVFEGRYTMNKNTGEWLDSDIKTPQELEKMLDRVDKLNLYDFMFPSNWESEKKRIFEKYGIRPKPLRSIRGPVTLAMSIYGAENLIFLYYDAPELFERFSKTISRVLLDMAKITDKEAGYEEGKAPHGFSFADDNCCLLTDEMYEKFGYPVLRDIFEYYCPNPTDKRYQHSDSPMEHLLPILGKLKFTECNFGPTVLVDKIRKNMPNTCIKGCISPITFMYNDTDAIIAEAKRDCERIKSLNSRGLNLATAGSVNNGSSLESLRAVMYAIQQYGRY